MAITSFKQMHNEIGTKGVILVFAVYTLIASAGCFTGNWLFRLCLRVFGLQE